MTTAVSSLNSASIVLQVQNKPLQLSDEAQAFFRHVPQSDMQSIQEMLQNITLPPPAGALESFKRQSYGDAIFSDPNWVLYAMWYFFKGGEEGLGADDYAALMVFDSLSQNILDQMQLMQSGGNLKQYPRATLAPHATKLEAGDKFTYLDRSSAPSFRQDFIEATTFADQIGGGIARFPREKLARFFDSLDFDSTQADSVFVVPMSCTTGANFSEEGKRLLHGKIIGESGCFYIFSPRTMQKFTRFMAEECPLDKPGRHFRAIGFDCVHMLSPVSDFESAENRPVFIPNRYLPHPEDVDGIPTVMQMPGLSEKLYDGVGIFLHDTIFHLLTLQSTIPLSHAQLWIEIAKQLKSKSRDVYENMLDFIMFYDFSKSSVDALIEHYNQYTQSVIVSQCFRGDKQACQQKMNKIFQSMPDMLKAAGVYWDSTSFELKPLTQ